MCERERVEADSGDTAWGYERRTMDTDAMQMGVEKHNGAVSVWAECELERKRSPEETSRAMV